MGVLTKNEKKARWEDLLTPYYPLQLLYGLNIIDALLEKREFES